jgi:hypothetical protein
MQRLFTANILVVRPRLSSRPVFVISARLFTVHCGCAFYIGVPQSDLSREKAFRRAA